MAEADAVPLPTLKPRAADAHKGTFGRVLIVAGSRGMAGAAGLCATAALRGGAGLVRVAVPADILPTVAGFNPCAMTAPLPCDAEGRVAAEAEAEVAALAGRSDVVVIGPGLGATSAVSRIVGTLLARSTLPLVLDADALNVLPDRLPLLKFRAVPAVLTPHPGEFSRLTGAPTPADAEGRRTVAVRFAQEQSAVLLLKGRGTIVTDGKRVFVNATGNPGMATGGSGDVLAGLIGALLGQGLAPFEAAQLGAHLHGLAGDLARDAVGEVSLVATDLIDFLPRAFRQYQG